MELVSAIGVPLSIRTILQIMGVPLERADDFHRWAAPSPAPSAATRVRSRLAASR
jgi:cytochrome P450